MTRTTAIGYYHQNMVAPCQKLTDHLTAPPKGAPRERMGRVRARQVVLAQGTLERPLVFDGNDRPGVMLASAAQAYLNRYGVKVGNRVVATSHDSAWHAAFDLAEADVGVTAIVDTRPDVAPALLEAAAAKRIEVLSGHTVTGTKGRLRVASVRVNPVRDGVVGPARRLACDALLMCGGWTPSLHLFSHTKGTLDWDEAAQVFLPGHKAEACEIAGAGRGLWGIAAALNDGAEAGAAGFEHEPVRYAVAKDRGGRGVTHKELPTAAPDGRRRSSTSRTT